MNLLVGSTGFIGGHLVEYLFQQGEISKGIFRKGSHLKIMDGSGVQGMEADLLDHHSLHEAVEGADTIYSLASPTPWGGDSGEYMRANTEGIRNLLEVAAEMKVKTIVHLSTLDVYGLHGEKTVDEGSVPSPTHPYQQAKLASEKTLLDFAEKNPTLRVTIVRAAKAVGSRDPSFVLPVLRMIEDGKVVAPSGSDADMSFSHPKDVAQAMFNAAKAEKLANPIYLIKSFDEKPVGIIQLIVKAVGKPVVVKKQSLLGGGSLIDDYTRSQFKAPIRLREQGTWKELGYAPRYTSEEVGGEVGQWYAREPWVTETQ